MGDTLLEPHRSYYRVLRPLLPLVKGLAHITGGGLPGNVPRILPEGLGVRFDSRSWTAPPVFKLVQDRGKVNRDEMFRVFNMGIGMVIICSPDNAAKIAGTLPEAKPIGEVVHITDRTDAVKID
ncbi:MAG: hypothetical protein HYX96_03345 [Chloroflexi bacterium]|nr:hypothetical protein [Chloroflexota bacterium]